MLNKKQIDRLMHACYEMRRDILDLCLQCGNQKGHLGGCMSTVEILAVLYLEIMNISQERIQKEAWEERDRFVLSKGHGGIALYAALRQAGILTKEHMLAGIRGEDTMLYRHPKYNPQYGIECSVGSLGMGIGYAVGLVEARRRQERSYRVYVMLGDGECDEGSVWESFAYAAHREMEELTVIIDKNNLQLDGKTVDVLNMDSLEEKIRSFGFVTRSVDGHNFEQIYDALHTSHAGKPLAIIANTVKGKGVSFAEGRVEWHDNILTEQLYRQAVDELKLIYGVYSAETERADRISIGRPVSHEKTYIVQDISLMGLPEVDSKNVVGVTANQIAGQDPLFCLVYSDCANRISIEKLKETHPGMCYETGIAEQNQVMVAAALAQEGFDVFAVAYAPFITARVLDQIRANLGYMESPVKLIGLSAGFAASDLGATHTALEDIANLRCIPNMTVICPADYVEAAKAMAAVITRRTPVYIRMTDGLNRRAQIVSTDIKFEIGKASVLREGTDVALIGCGAILSEVLKASDQLEKQGISCKVLNMHTVKPLDEQALRSLETMRLIVTVEEHSVLGGLGGAVAEYLSGLERHAPLLRIGVPDQYYKADLPQNEMVKSGLSADMICKRILKILS